MRIGVDIGGTFTDIVLARPDGHLHVNKTTTTAADPGEGVVAGIRAVLAEAGLAATAVTEIVHGTTVASNTILQRAGARTGLLTTRGFRDVLEIGRIRTPGMFDLRWRKPEPLVPRRWRVEVAERIGPDGAIITRLDEAAVADAAAFFRAEGIEAVAICFLHSYANPRHEQRAAALLAAAAPELMVTASCDVLPEIKEYERTSTAVVNAYLLPNMRVYLSRLRDRLAAMGITAPVQVMASNGGMIALETARQRPVFAVGSGPAGGVAGAARLGPAVGQPDLIVFDMGGTTAKAAIVTGGQPALVTEYEFRDGISSPSRFTKGGGYMLKVPAVDIAEVGSGGGSLARIDAGGLLVVGPQSAGGDPGPACYGRGNLLPTVTDANMVLGLLNPTALAGGSLKVDPALSIRAVAEHVATPLNLSVEDAAHGIRAIADATMARALRAVTVERGRDPRDMAMMVFGGGGPLHAVGVARRLGITQVLISPVSGVFSAAGMLSADAVKDFVRPVLRRLADLTAADVTAAVVALERDGRAALRREGYASGAELRFSADLCFLGQSSQLTVPLPLPFDAVALGAAFATLYGETFGYRPDEPMEFVNLRLAAIGTGDRLRFETLSLDLAGTEGTRNVSFFRGQPRVPTRLLPRAALTTSAIAGPAIIESYDTTIVVPPGCTARAEPCGCIAITIGEADD